MNDFSEDQIWDTIMESAKDKIQYEAFAALFPFNPDNFLSSIIYGFAVSRSGDLIAEKIAAQVFMTGNTVNKEALGLFINQSQLALQLEIALTAKALHLLDDGEEPELVYNTVLEALNS
jgi:hypothetical protein